jgi:hypothetical protein
MAHGAPGLEWRELLNKPGSSYYLKRVDTEGLSKSLNLEYLNKSSVTVTVTVTVTRSLSRPT